MTKTQAKKRLNEARAKVLTVYVARNTMQGMGAVTTADMAAIEKILDKCLKRLN
tara:strand:+ start:1104 stop:1265 length:162 start_codon:yes stop_codon:yes gene_type:complete